MTDIIDYQPTMSLRFIERDGKRILQQQWRVPEYAWMEEWRDVPLVKENEDHEAPRTFNNPSGSG
jgi:hypothetical protein